MPAKQLQQEILVRLTDKEHVQMLRTSWTKLVDAINKNRPDEAYICKLVELPRTDNGPTFHATLCDTRASLKDERLEWYTLGVRRDETAHTTAVRGYHTHTYKDTFSIHVDGTRLVPNLPKKRFPQLKDGGHNYDAAAQYFWEVHESAARARSQARERETLREHNTTIADALPATLRISAYGFISASLLEKGKLNTAIKFGRELTPEQATRLIELLRQFDASILSED